MSTATTALGTGPRDARGHSRCSGNRGTTHARCRTRCSIRSSGPGPWRASGWGPTARRRIGIQDGPGVVVGARVLGIRVLGEDNQPARVIRPVPQGMQLERAPNRGSLRRRLDPSEGVSESHTPPAVHVFLHRPRHVPGGVTVHRKQRRNHAVRAGTRGERTGEDERIPHGRVCGCEWEIGVRT